MKLKAAECPKKGCGKAAVVAGESFLGKTKMVRLECGHVFVEKDLFSEEESKPVFNYIHLKQREFFEEHEVDRFADDGNGQLVNYIDPSFYSLDQSLCSYPFQIDGVFFAEKTKLNCLIADEMGLGKTIQAVVAMKRAKKKTLIMCKGSIMFQWAHQIKKWANDHPLGVMPIIDRNCILAGFDVYIISIDLISRKENKRGKAVLDLIKALNIELLIVDECQNFKDASSARTKALITFIQDCRIEHKIFLSGTPIKNRANEYFVILNLLDPGRFNSYINFCRTWLIPNEKGVYTRLDPGMIEKFREVTSKYIIRREVKDVQKNLPKKTRDFQWIKIEDPLVKNSYNSELEQFENFLRTASRVDTTSLLGWLARMRSITGIAKIPWAIEYTAQFLDQTDKALVLGIHHHAVRDMLYLKLGAEGYDPLKFSGEDNQFAKERIKSKFINQENRLMIMNMIAGGTGTDGLQAVCHNAVILERGWSSADEEQFEKRFDRDGQKYPCNMVYPIAEGTIDEWFYDLVETKREILRETMGDSEAASYDPMSDSGLIRELAEKTVRHKL